MGVNDININVRANVVNVQQAMQQVGSSIQGATNQVKNMHGPFATVTKDLSATANFSRTASGAVTQFGNSAQQSTSRLQRFGEAFKGNRGIVFGIAGLTSALAEAVGMMGMYGDSAMRLGEAQQKLNSLIDKGVTSGKAYMDAQAEVTKQQRFFNMVQRNTILSQMDMLFFTTMAVSGLIKLGTGGTKVGGIFSKLKGIFMANNAAMMQGSGALAHLATAQNTAAAGANNLGKSVGFLGLSIKGLLIGTGIGAAAVGIGLLIQKFMEWQEAAKKTAEDNKAATEQVKLDMEVWQRISKQTGESFLTDWEGMSDASVEHAGIIVESIRRIQTEDSISSTRAAMEAANRMQAKELEVQFQIESELRVIEAARAAALAKEQIAGRPHLKKAYQEQSEQEKLLNVQLEESKDRAAAYGETISNLAARLEGLTSGTQKFQNLQQRLTDNINVAKSEVLSTADAWDQLSQAFLAGGNNFANADTVMKGVVKQLKDMQFAGEINGEQADELTEKFMAWLGVTKEGATAAVAEMAKMGNQAALLSEEFVKLSESSMKTWETQAMSQFWDAFNIGSSDAMALWEEAGKRVDSFFQTWGKSIEAGMDPQLKFNELLADTPIFLKGIMQIRYEQWLTKQKEETKAASKEIDEHTKKLLEEKEALMESITALSERGLAATMNRESNEALAQAYDDTIGSIIEEGNAIKAQNELMNQLTPSMQAAVDEANNYRLAQAAVIPILEKGFVGQQAYTNAVIEGTQAYSDHVQNLLAGNVASNTERDLLIARIQGYKDLVNPMILTNDELKEYDVAMNMSRDATVQFVRAQQQASDSSLEFFSSLTSADSMKDFGKAWKELDLGAVPKKFRDDFKDMMEEFKKGVENAEEFQVGMNLATLAIDQLGQKGADVDLDELQGTFKKLSDEYDKFVKIDPEAVLLQKFVSQLSNMNTAELQKLPLTFAAVNEAMADNNITWDEYIKINKLHIQETGKAIPLNEEAEKSIDALNTATGEGIDPHDKLARQINQISINQSIYARTIVQTTANIQALTKATNELYKAQTDPFLQQGEMGMGGYWENWAFENFQKKTDDIVKKKKGLPADDSYSQSRQWGEHYRNVGLNNTPGMDQNVPTPEQQKAMWDPMAMAAGEASKQVQTVFSAMFVALNGIFTGIATHWSAQMNSMGPNAQSGASQVQSVMTTMVDNSAGLMNLLGSHWSLHMNKMGENAQSGGDQIYDVFTTTIDNVAGLMNMLGTHWSMHMNKVQANASAGGNGIRNNFEKALDDVENRMTDLAKHWSKMCNSMIANAKSAAKGIQKAMDSIKDTESVHTIRTVRVGQSKGGVWSMEDGGISAAGGLTVSNGPTNWGPFTYGDNSGGREIHAFIPLDGRKADKIMDQLDAMTGRKRITNVAAIGGGERDIVVPITVNINGEQYSFTQRYRIKQGHDIANQVF